MNSKTAPVKICRYCGAKLYSGFGTPRFCPRCKKPWVKENPIRHTKEGWFFGSQGPFSTRNKALEVMRAMYASGYRGKNPTLVVARNPIKKNSLVGLATISLVVWLISRRQT